MLIYGISIRSSYHPPVTTKDVACLSNYLFVYKLINIKIICNKFFDYTLTPRRQVIDLEGKVSAQTPLVVSAGKVAAVTIMDR